MEATKLSGWAIVEIMGHQKYVGQVSEMELGGTSMLRVDIPAAGERAAVTKVFGWSAVFCLTMVSEDIATALQHTNTALPFSSYDMPEEWRAAMRDYRAKQQQQALTHCDSEDDDNDECGASGINTDTW